MPRDSRLYMTFPIDMPDHPKVRPLSAASKWFFVEMNAYSRRLNLDGRIPSKVARMMWPKKALDELVASDPERPLVLLDGDDYVIRDYADHQLTADAIDRLREKRSRAGSKGAASRWQNDGTAIASAMANGWQDDGTRIAESESESELEEKTDITHVPEVSQVGDVVTQWTDQEKSQARIAGITDAAGMHELLVGCCGRMTHSASIVLASAICARSQKPVKRVDAYVRTAVKSSPDDVRWEFDRLDLGATA